MPGLNIGYARVCTDQQDLTAQTAAAQPARDTARSRAPDTRRHNASAAGVAS
jgi:hypothetical protein